MSDNAQRKAHISRKRTRHYYTECRKTQKPHKLQPKDVRNSKYLPELHKTEMLRRMGLLQQTEKEERKGKREKVMKITIDLGEDINLADYAAARVALEDEEDLLTGEGFKADDTVLCLHNDRNRSRSKHDVDKFVKVGSIKDWCIEHANANARVDVVANAIVARVALDTIHGEEFEATREKVSDELRSMIREIGWEWLFGDISEMLCDEVSEGFAYEMEG